MWAEPREPKRIRAISKECAGRSRLAHKRALGRSTRHAVPKPKHPDRSHQDSHARGCFYWHCRKLIWANLVCFSENGGQVMRDTKVKVCWLVTATTASIVLRPFDALDLRLANDVEFDALSL